MNYIRNDKCFVFLYSTSCRHWSHVVCWSSWLVFFPPVCSQSRCALCPLVPWEKQLVRTMMKTAVGVLRDTERDLCVLSFLCSRSDLDTCLVSCQLLIELVYLRDDSLCCDPVWFCPKVDVVCSPVLVTVNYHLSWVEISDSKSTFGFISKKEAQWLDQSVNLSIQMVNLILLLL